MFIGEMRRASEQKSSAVSTSPNLLACRYSEAPKDREASRLAKKRKESISGTCNNMRIVERPLLAGALSPKSVVFRLFVILSFRF